MTTTKPYLLRAIHEWAEDNGYTPQVLVNATFAGVDVPNNHVVDGQIVLNISIAAVQGLVMGNEELHFSARFNGQQYNIYLPMDSVMAIFARENSQGIFFEETDPEDPEPEQVDQQYPDKKTEKVKKRKASHLKIIK